MVLWLVAAALCGLGIALWFLAERRWRWPRGHRVEGEYMNFKATLIYDDEAKRHFKYEPEKIAQACALASYCLTTAFLGLRTKRGWRADIDSMMNIAVHVIGDASYDKQYNVIALRHYGTHQHTAGMLTSIGMYRGHKRKPLVACRASKFNTMPVTGGIVTHELVHHLVQKLHRDLPLEHNDYYDAGHSLQDFWAGKSTLSLESTGIGIFIKLRERIGIKA